jgi:phosphate transport system substrate-binding protein
MRTDYPADQNEPVLKFFDWCLKNDAAHKQATALDYVPLPTNVVGLIETSWQQRFKDPSGKPIWTASTR